MSAAKSGALFVGLVVLLVGAAAVVPFVGGAGGGTEYSPVENENFQPDRIVAEESPLLADSGSTVSVPFPPIRSETSSPLSTLCSAAHSAGRVIASVDGPNRCTFRVSIP